MLSGLDDVGQQLLTVAQPLSVGQLLKCDVPLLKRIEWLDHWEVSNWAFDVIAGLALLADE